MPPNTPKIGNKCRHFPRPDLGPNIAPSQFKNEEKLPKMVYLSSLHFGENFIKT